MSLLYRLSAPVLGRLPPETGHALTIRALRLRLVPRQPAVDDQRLQTTVLGLSLTNPIGLAAGFDKNAEVVDAMLGQGFGFVEVGSVTPRPQPGNPRPRVFRLPSDEAVINRLGFNSHGASAVAARLAGRRRRGIVGLNIGTNRDSTDRIADFAAVLSALGPYVDYTVVNVSSPNTPGLRDLQSRENLGALAERLLAERAHARLSLPILVKLSPDLDARQVELVGASVIEAGFDGFVVANTTLTRPETLTSPAKTQSGGLSGRPLFDRSTEMLRRLFRVTGGKLPIIGVGGVSSGEDAYAKIRAGASLVQFYTALIYQGPGLVAAINLDLAARLRADGFASVSAAVGADHNSG